MIVLAVSGRSNVGKTSSIRLATEKLFQEKWVDQIEKTETDPDLNGKDFRKFVQLKNGLRFCVCSGGDDEAVIVANFNFVKDHPCDILIMGVQTKRGTHQPYFYNKLTAEDSLVEVYPVQQTNRWQSPRSEKLTGNDFANFHKLSAEHILYVLRFILETEYPGYSNLLDFV